MRKQILILAGAAMILTSCGSNNNSNQNAQAQMDSVAKANAALQDQINKTRNDSTINAIATAKADSIEKELHKGSAHEGEHKEHRGDRDNQQNQPPVTQDPPPPAPAPTAQDNKFNNRQPGNQQTGTKLTPEQQQAQDDKFNRRGGK